MVKGEGSWGLGLDDGFGRGGNWRSLMYVGIGMGGRE